MTDNGRIIDFLVAGLESEAGVPLSGGKVYTYSAGTTTFKNTWTVRDKSAISSNPLILDTYGRVIAFGDGVYRFDIRDASDNLIKTVDNYEVFFQPYWYDVRSYASINAAVTAIGTTQAVLFVPNAQTLTANLIIPSTLTLKIIKGGSIVKASTYTLTINGSLEAGPYKVFSGFSGTDILFGFGSVEEIYAEWFGATGDGTTDDTATWVACIACAMNTSGSTSLKIKCLSSKYHITGSGLSIPYGSGRCFHLEGVGGQRGGAGGEFDGTVFYKTGVGNSALSLGDIADLNEYHDQPTMKNISFVGTVDTDYGLDIYVNYGFFENVMVTGFNQGVQFRGTATFLNCNFEENVLDGFFFEGANDTNRVTFYNPTFNGNGRYGFYDGGIAANFIAFYKPLFVNNHADGLRCLGDVIRGFRLDGGWFEGNNSTVAGNQCHLVPASQNMISPLIINTRFTSPGAAALKSLRMDGTTDATLINNDFDAAADVNLGTNPRLTVIGMNILHGQTKIRAYLAANQLNIANGVPTKVLLDSETFDTDGEFTGNKFTCKNAGYYEIKGRITYTNVIALKLYGAFIYKGGAEVSREYGHSGLADNLSVPVSDSFYLAVGDYIELYAYCEPGVDTVDILGGAIQTYLTVTRLPN